MKDNETAYSIQELLAPHIQQAEPAKDLDDLDLDQEEISDLPLHLLCDDIYYRKIQDIENVLFTEKKLGERYILVGARDQDEVDSNEEGEVSEQNETTPVKSKTTKKSSRKTSDVSYYMVEPRFLSKKLRDSEKPEEAMIELLMVIASQDKSTAFSKAFIDQSGREMYLRPRQVKLRRLLFNNPLLEYYDSRSNLTDQEKWTKWGEKFIESNYREVDSDRTIGEILDPELNSFYPFILTAKSTKSKSSNTKTKISYKVFLDSDIERLRETFGDFSSFTKAIMLLRSWSYANEDKQWCGSFLFPFGPDCLYSDITINHQYSHNNMAGAGLLVYSMIQRSSSREMQSFIYQGLSKRFLEAGNSFNVIARSLQGRNSQEAIDSFKIGVHESFVEKVYGQDQGKELDTFKQSNTAYLPYCEHRVYEQVASDFNNLIAINLNQQELFHVLALISMLNLVVYYLEVCQSLNQASGIETNIDMVVECNHSPGNPLRNMAIDRLKSNNSLLEEATRNTIKLYMQYMFPTLNSGSMLTRLQFEKVQQVLKDAFEMDEDFLERCDFEACVDKDLKASNKASYDKLQRVFCDFVKDRADNFSGLHRMFGQRIGLVSRDMSRSYRYVLTDDLLRALVLCTVEQNDQLMLLDDFLEQLYQKYHIVIGPKQGSKYYDLSRMVNVSMEQAHFKDNLSAFKDQLAHMGFLIELSDSNAYIKNPYLA